MADDLVLTFEDPKGVFKARIKNIPRSEFTKPFLLSLHLYFDANDLEDAKDASLKILSNCLNMLAFTTGCGFRLHRTRQIVDANDPAALGMRDVLVWSENVEYDDPQPFLTSEIAKTIARLLEFDVPPAIRRALRWYRLGIDADSPDDQFTYFWFALEIVAEFQKPTTKVNDSCPRCRSALYCEQCETHPTHRPYAKQAIRALMLSSDEDCDDATVNLLDFTRNSLMHGSTLKEIQDTLPDPHESVVDILGRLLWKALVKQFPAEMFDGQLYMGFPSTFVHYKASAVAHIRTVVPKDDDGHFNLAFSGMTVKMQPSGPPQSASPFVVRMSHEQYDQLLEISYALGDHQEMLKRIVGRAREEQGAIHALVLATDMAVIRRALESKEEGRWQDVFSAVLNPVEPNNP